MASGNGPAPVAPVTAPPPAGTRPRRASQVKAGDITVTIPTGPSPRRPPTTRRSSQDTPGRRRSYVTNDESVGEVKQAKEKAKEMQQQLDSINRQESKRQWATITLQRWFRGVIARKALLPYQRYLQVLFSRCSSTLLFEQYTALQVRAEAARESRDAQVRREEQAREFRKLVIKSTRLTSKLIRAGSTAGGAFGEERYSMVRVRQAPYSFDQLAKFVALDARGKFDLKAMLNTGHARQVMSNQACGIPFPKAWNEGTLWQFVRDTRLWCTDLTHARLHQLFLKHAVVSQREAERILARRVFSSFADSHGRVPQHLREPMLIVVGVPDKLLPDELDNLADLVAECSDTQDPASPLGIDWFLKWYDAYDRRAEPLWTYKFARDGQTMLDSGADGQMHGALTAAGFEALLKDLAVLNFPPGKDCECAACVKLYGEMSIARFKTVQIVASEGHIKFATQMATSDHLAFVADVINSQQQLAHGAIPELLQYPKILQLLVKYEEDLRGIYVHYVTQSWRKANPATATWAEVVQHKLGLCYIDFTRFCADHGLFPGPLSNDAENGFQVLKIFLGCKHGDLAGTDHVCIFPDLPRLETQPLRCKLCAAPDFALPKSELLQLRQCFEEWDVDNSGDLTKDEVAAFLKAAGRLPSEAALTHMLAVMDADGNGRISFPEFVQGFATGRRLEHRARATILTFAEFVHSFLLLTETLMTNPTRKPEHLQYDDRAELLHALLRLITNPHQARAGKLVPSLPSVTRMLPGVGSAVKLVRATPTHGRDILESDSDSEGSVAEFQPSDIPEASSLPIPPVSPSTTESGAGAIFLELESILNEVYQQYSTMSGPAGSQPFNLEIFELYVADSRLFRRVPTVEIEQVFLQFAGSKQQLTGPEFVAANFELLRQSFIWTQTGADDGQYTKPLKELGGNAPVVLFVRAAVVTLKATFITYRLPARRQGALLQFRLRQRREAKSTTNLQRLEDGSDPTDRERAAPHPPLMARQPSFRSQSPVCVCMPPCGGDGSRCLSVPQTKAIAEAVHKLTGGFDEQPSGAVIDQLAGKGRLQLPDGIADAGLLKVAAATAEPADISELAAPQVRAVGLSLPSSGVAKLLKYELQVATAAMPSEAGGFGGALPTPVAANGASAHSRDSVQRLRMLAAARARAAAAAGIALPAMHSTPATTGRHSTAVALPAVPTVQPGPTYWRDAAGLTPIVEEEVVREAAVVIPGAAERVAAGRKTAALCREIIKAVKYKYVSHEARKAAEAKAAAASRAAKRSLCNFRIENGRTKAITRDFMLAMSTWESALEIARVLSDNKRKGTILHLMGSTCLEMRRPADAVPYLLEARECLRTLPKSSPVMSQVILLTGAALQQLRLFEHATAAFQDVIHLTADASEWRVLCEALEGKAQALCGLGLLEGALSAYQRALTIAESQDDMEWQARVHAGIGNVCMALGEYSEAGEQYQSQLLKSSTMYRTELKMLSHVNLARIALLQSRLDDGVKHVVHAIPLARACGDRHHLAQCYADLAMTTLRAIVEQREMTSFDMVAGRTARLSWRCRLPLPVEQRLDCERLIMLALQLWKLVDSTSGMQVGYRYLAELECACNNAPKALEYAQQAVQMATQANDWQAEALGLSTLALMFEGMGRAAEAQVTWQQCCQVASVLQQRRLSAVAHSGVGRLACAVQGPSGARESMHHFVQAMEVLEGLHDHVAHRAAMTDLADAHFMVGVSSAIKAGMPGGNRYAMHLQQTADSSIVFYMSLSRHSKASAPVECVDGDAMTPEQHLRRAADLYRQAFIVATRLEQDFGICRAAAGLGATHAFLLEARLALDGWQQALRAAERIQDALLLSTAWEQVGVCFAWLNCFKEAMPCFEMHRTLCIQLKDRVGLQRASANFELTHTALQRLTALGSGSAAGQAVPLHTPGGHISAGLAGGGAFAGEGDDDEEQEEDLV